MEIKRYIIKTLFIEGNEVDIIDTITYNHGLSDSDNFTMNMNKIKYLIHEKKLVLHTIRIAQNCPHLLYHRSNTYDSDGRYRYGYDKGPIIGEVKTINSVYLYDEDNNIIGSIFLEEIISEI